MEAIGNRIVAFCKGAPAPSIMRVHVHAGSDPAHLVEVERVWGDRAPLTHMTERFASTPEDETLLVSLARDGTVLGTAWPVFRENVSLEFGIPDMKESEAAALLGSPNCTADLRALRDRGVRPAGAEGHAPEGRGCAHCATHGGSGFDAASAVLVAVTTVAVATIARRRRMISRDHE
jgi:hypothetical protein